MLLISYVELYFATLLNALINSSNQKVIESPGIFRERMVSTHK